MNGRAGYLKKNKIGVCCMCRNVFKAARSDKKTCSDKCRKAWQRYNDDRKKDLYKPISGTEQHERLSAIINKTMMNMGKLR